MGRPSDELIAASDIEALHRACTTAAVIRRNARQGRHAAENLIAAARAVYNRAIADGLIDPRFSPAHRVSKPRRLPSTRRALTPQELIAITNTARTIGNDVILDTLLLRFHIETAARRGGALALRLIDLDIEHCLVLLREKGGTIRWQPISPPLTTALADHAACRGAVLPTDALLRYRDGHPCTTRRYDHLWHRIGQHLPWVTTHGISPHWLRHTTLTLGRTPLRLRHRPRLRRPHRHHQTSNHHLHQSQPHDIATALSTMTGQPHPLAHQDNGQS